MATAIVQAISLPSSNRVEPGSVNVPLARFPVATKAPEDPDEVANALTNSFNLALDNGDCLALSSLFLDDSYWRDHLAMSWDFHTMKGRDEVFQFVRNGCHLRNVEVDRTSTFRAPHVGTFDGNGEAKGVEFFWTFKTNVGSGQGVVRLLNGNGKWGIFTLFTTLGELEGHEAAVGPRRSKGVEHGGKPDRKNWLERRVAESKYDGMEPAVLILGAGQGGLTIAARLKVLGVDALIVDQEDQIGDNWRNRYHQLVLHDPIWFDHLPYVSFPTNWPIFTPKDKLADFFECYAKILELNVWTKTTITKSSWSDTDRQWNITLKRTLADGNVETRVLHPRHVIQATGHSGKMNFPSQMKGIENFRGDALCHSSQFRGARQNTRNKKAIVVGSCNSAHDISQDFYEKGYDVTMVQRSSTCVVTSESITKIALAGLYDESGPPVEDADLWLHGTPTSVLKAIQVKVTDLQGEHDAALLKGLEQAGFKLDRGPDGSGLFMKYFQRGGGYYIDVGASQLIVDGKIKVKQGQEIQEVLPHGLRFADGSELQADEIIFATGYQNMRTQTRHIFGDEVADRVGDVWGFDAEGEMRTIWRQTGHPGFWYMGGNLALARYYSRLLALQIKAREEGLVN